MMKSIDLGALRDRLQATAATALGLLLIVILCVYLVPRQSDIAAHFDQARFEAAAEAAEKEEPAPAEEADMASEPDGSDDPALPPEETAPDAAPPASAPDAAPPAAPAVEDTSVASIQKTQPAAGGDPAPRLLARPVALDTGTILIQQGKVRLAGVAPLPLNRKCGEGRESWFCGVEARTQFRSWLRARSISCKVPDGFGEKPEEVTSTCSLSQEDIGRWLVANGWAEADPAGPYAEAEAAARKGRLGVWAERRPGA